MVDLVRPPFLPALFAIAFTFAPLTACDETLDEPCRAVLIESPMELPVRGDGVLLLGDLADDDTLVPWEDGQTVTLADGFQGGYMVTPSVALPMESLSCTTIRLDFSIDGVPMAGGAFTGNYEPSPDGGVVSLPLFALLGFLVDELVGRELTMTALAYTEEWRSEPDTRTVVLGAPE